MDYDNMPFSLSEHLESVNTEEEFELGQEPRGIIDQSNRPEIDLEPRPSSIQSPTSFKDYLAHLMQIPPCPGPPGCYIPSNVDICGVDDRTIMDNPVGMTPNQWICRVVVEATGGPWWQGSAFKVKISPDVGRTVLFTAAHVLRNRGGGYVPRIRVQCPGEAEVAVVRNNDVDMWMSNEFLNRQDYNHDYAYFTYAGNSNAGFGWQGFIDTAAIVAAGTDLHNCGYPTQQDTCVSRCVLPVSPPAQAKQYCDQGSLDRADDYNIFARVDIDFGQSGSPLYEQTGNNYIAYGIVSLPSQVCPDGREFDHITAEKLYHMFSHMGVIQGSFRVKSSQNVYLHMNGAVLNTANRVGGDVYAGQMNNIDDTFKIFPVYQSSSNQANSQLVAIRSATQNNIYLRMDGTGIVANLGHGGGTVNCRYGIDDGAMEAFHKEVEADGQVAFRSKTFNNVYLRIDHWEVNGPGDRGTVNAQFGKSSLETHHLEPVP